MYTLFRVYVGRGDINPIQRAKRNEMTDQFISIYIIYSLEFYLKVILMKFNFGADLRDVP